MPLGSWSNDLTKEETAEVKKLLPALKEAVSHLSRDYGFVRLISVFMRRRIQPLQARPSTMWQYSGSEDASRMGRADLEEEALSSAIHGVIKGAKNEELPSNCLVNPYGGGRELPEVQTSTSSASFRLLHVSST